MNEDEEPHGEEGSWCIKWHRVIDNSSIVQSLNVMNLEIFWGERYIYTKVQRKTGKGRWIIIENGHLKNKYFLSL